MTEFYISFTTYRSKNSPVSIRATQRNILYGVEKAYS
nr:MAG TPA: hypothetical protein [Caudoviricetes sp.]